MNCTIDQQKKNSIGFYRNQDESFECQAIVWFAEFVNGNECDVVVVFLAALRNAFEFIVLYQFRINSLSFNWVSSMAPTVTLLSTESFTFCFCSLRIFRNEKYARWRVRYNRSSWIVAEFCLLQNVMTHFCQLQAIKWQNECTVCCFVLMKSLNENWTRSSDVIIGCCQSRPH